MYVFSNVYTGITKKRIIGTLDIEYVDKTILKEGAEKSEASSRQESNGKREERLAINYKMTKECC